MQPTRPIALVILLVALLSADRALHYLSPVQLSTVGHRRAVNACFYGWGFDSGDEVRLRDPDTGATFTAPVNNHGWRDRDREYAKPSGTFRIVALGDSNTFGVLVPLEQTWTRLLEEKLTNDGWKVEVLNIGYPGWGTDQELEALRREGVRYEPDLVILQFTINDLTDNEVQKTDPTRKPFYYQFDETGALQRHDNSAFARDGSSDTLHWLAAHSELLKRSYIAWTNVAQGFAPRYFASSPQVDQLRTVLSLKDDDPLLLALSAKTNAGLTEADVDALIRKSDHLSDRTAIYRILENRPFKQLWMPLQYDPPPPDQREDWRLLLGLIKEMQATAVAAGADLAILSDQEEGLYDWERYWLRIGPGPAIKERFLAPTTLLRSFAAENGIGFIDNRAKHVRARNDSHPNAEGTRAMAANAYDYVTAHYRDRLEATSR